MTLRELLQREIWSKRTTRRIWIVSACMAVLGLVVFGWHQLDTHWLTPPERAAGRAALQEIEVLEGASDQQFDSQEQKASRVIEAAEKAAWTRRDRQISGVLAGYLSILKDDRRVSNLQARMAQSGRADLASKLAVDPMKLHSPLNLILHEVLD
jgi:hypothetical protein